MTDVLFYHLERQPLEKVLPRLVERTLQRGWRAVIQAGSADRVEALSTLLWTYSDDSFLPHGSASDGSADRQPVWLTQGAENPNHATVRFFTDGAEAESLAGLERAVFIFDGNDAEAVEGARSQWKKAKAEGHAVSYWQQDDQGRWQNRA